MARPVNADAAATRARILESAQRLFAASGQDGASIRDVARASGVSLAMVHHYYGSKDDLYAACVDSMYTELEAMGAELALVLSSGTSGSPRALLERAVSTGYHFALAHQTAVRLLLRATVDAGHLNPRGRVALLGFLDVAATGLGAMLDRPAASLRLPLQTVIFLVARYAVHDEAELGDIAGTTREKARGAVEHHLVSVATALLADRLEPRKKG